MRREADQRRREAEDMEKYGGVRASRKELYGGGSASEGEGSEVGDDVLDDGEVPAGGDDDEVDELEEEDDEDVLFGQAEGDESSSSDEDAPFTPAAAASSSAPAPIENLEATQILSSLRQSRSEDISKGLAVKKQLEHFENVLLVRMKLQKAVVGLGALSVSSAWPP